MLNYLKFCVYVYLGKKCVLCNWKTAYLYLIRSTRNSGYKILCVIK